MGCGSSTATGAAVPIAVLPAEQQQTTNNKQPAPPPPSAHASSPTPCGPLPTSPPPPSPLAPPASPVDPNQPIPHISPRNANQRVYSAEHASSLPAPRTSLSIQRSQVARVETEHVRGRSARDNMPAVSELLTSANVTLPMRLGGALLPNFYRSAAFPSGVGVVGGGVSVGGVSSDDATAVDSYDSSHLDGGWSDDEEELDEEEHRETLDMLQELTALSVPSPGLKKQQATPAPAEDGKKSANGTNSTGGQPIDAKSPASGPTPTPAAAHGSTLLVPGAPLAPSIAPLTGKNSRATPRRAHIHSAGTETLFHGFYAKRCIHTVKKSMASSGMFLTFKDMFDRLDPDHTGFISRSDWAKLLQKLGLPVDSATSLSRMVGLADTPTITLEQFAMVMALSMHGPYVRLLQSTQNAKRNEIFIGGDKSASSEGWRKEAMAILANHQIPYFNPTDGDVADAATPANSSSSPYWNAELVILEALAKTQCTMMLFVVDGLTRNISSMVEASEHITSEKEVLLVMQNVAPDTRIAGETLTPAETKDLNRGRAYLADVAHRNAHSGVMVFKSIGAACDYIIGRASGQIVRPSLKAFTKQVIALPTAMPIANTNTTATPNATTATTPTVDLAAASQAALASAQSHSHSHSASLPPIPPPNNAQQTANNNAPKPHAAASPKGKIIILSKSNASSTADVSPHASTGAAGSIPSPIPGSTPPLAPSSSPLSLSLMSTLARRHSTGIGRGSVHGVPGGGGGTGGGISPPARPIQSYSNAFTSTGVPLHATPNNAASSSTPAVPSTAGVLSSSSVGSVDGFLIEWPSNPQPGDFDKYLASSHFQECVKIVFKHQGLLSRRAAVKAAQQQASGPGSPLPSMVQSPPPGLFRMASSPFSPLKLMKPSGSTSNLNSVELGLRSQANAATATTITPTATATATATATHTATHVGSASTSPEAPMRTASPVSTRDSMPSTNASRDASSGAPEVSQFGSSVNSSVSHSRVLVRMVSHTSDAPGKSNYSPSATRPTTSGSPVGASGTILAAPPAAAAPAAAATHSRNPSSGTIIGGGLSTSSSQSKLLDPLTAAGLTVTIAPPVASTYSNSVGVTAGRSAESDSDAVSVTHLFTMLMRLHEIIQLSTGIAFLHPYPSLVASELDAAALYSSGDDSDRLRLADWSILAKKVFGQLRGIHEAISPTSPIVTNRRAIGVAGSADAASSAIAPSTVASTNIDRRSQTRFSTPRGLSIGAIGAIGATNATGADSMPSTPMMGVGISPSQFIRHLGAHHQPGKRSSGTPIQTADSAPPHVYPPLSLDDLTPGQQPPHRPMVNSARVPLQPSLTASDAANGNASKPPAINITSANATHLTISTASPSTTSPVVGHTLHPPSASPPPASSVAHHQALMQRVKARSSAQRKVIELMSPRGRTMLDEANALSGADLSKLSSSVAASLEHDHLLLKEMSPSLSGMFTSIDASKKGLVSMADVEHLLAHKLQLPTQSVESLMQVMQVALKTCQHEAESHTPNAKEDEAKTIDSPSAALITPLPLAAFDPASLSFPAFCAVLSKTLHLQSNTFSSFLSPPPDMTQLQAMRHRDAPPSTRSTGGFLRGSYMQAMRQVTPSVFLGGACGSTTWRVDEAIPILESANVTLFNPQVDNWSEELVLIESLIKQNCEILLFVIDSETRAIASMIEAAEYICSGRDVVLVVKSFPPSGASVGGESLSVAQVQDLNRARTYVTDVAQRHGLDVFTDITLACEYIVTKLHEKQSKEEAYSAEVETFTVSDEFIEKSFEEFVRCDLGGAGRLDSAQLLLACLHLEQDLRPLLPPQSAKYRQPSMADVDAVMHQFATNGTREIDAEQFLEFSRVLFRNVCAHVKL